MGQEKEELKVLVIPLEWGMKKKVRQMIEGRPLKLEFIDRKRMEDMSLKKFCGNDLVCLVGSIDSVPILTFFETPKAKTGKKVKRKESIQITQISKFETLFSFLRLIHR